MSSKPRKRKYYRYRDQDGKLCTPRTPGAAKCVDTSDIYYGYHQGEHVPLHAEYGVSKRWLARLQAGLPMLDPEEEARLNPDAGGADAQSEPTGPTVRELLDQYRAHLLASGDTELHAQKTARYIERVFPDLDTLPLTDLVASRANKFINELQTPKKNRPRIPSLPPGETGYRPADVAKLIGISTAAIAKSICKRNLSATGHGKARRYPRETVEALIETRAQPSGPETANHYIRALRSFGRWLGPQGNQHLAADPFASVRLVNASTDRRHDRRELLPDEVRKLLDVAEQSKKRRNGLRGKERKALYLFAYSTGWRASACAGVTPSDFHLDAETPHVVMPARRNKSRKTRKQPLPADAAAFFRDYLVKCKAAPTKPLFRGSRSGGWVAGAAVMLRRDLADAGIPYTIDGPDGPLYADFHALRHSNITALGRAGVDLRTVQELAGHSTPVLTARYMHRDLGDMARGAAKLPSVLGSGGQPQSG